MAQQQVDGSGQYAEAISSPTSPQHGLVSPMSEMMANTPPIPVESHHGFTQDADKKHIYNPATDYSGLEAVEPYPPQYGQYGGPPPGSPPVHQATGYEQDKEAAAAGEAAPNSNEEPKIFGIARRTFFIMLFGIIAIVVLVIALGAGLGVGLKKKDSSNNAVVQDEFCRENPDLCVGGALNAEYYSKTGAFNGTGIAIAGESWNKNQRRIFTLYFQHHTGDLRYMQYRTDRKWEGGDKTYTVASDAKNGTAISAVSYALNGTQYFHLFYVSKNNTIKQITQSNSTEDSGHWEKGPLTDLNLKVLDAPTVGLQACWKGDYYGDTNPVGEGENEVRQEDLRGINIWFASEKTTYEQYSWNNGKDEWTRESPWTGKNAYAGVGCYSWDTAPLAYTMMVNDKNATEFWWKDTNSSLTSTETHPINSWKNSTAGSIQGVHPLSAMGFTTYLYMQMADRSIAGFNVTWQAENTTAKPDSFKITNLGGPMYGLAGTHLSATAYTEYKDVQKGNETVQERQWDSLYVFYQTTGNDIGAFSRPISGGEWTKGTLEIPTD